MYNLFIVSFMKRYWKLLLVLVALVLLGKVDQVTYFVGPMFYLFSLLVGCAAGAMFVKHIVFYHTIDKFTEDKVSGTQSPFEDAWTALDAATKLRYTILIIAVMFLGACWIAASIAK